MNAINTQEIKQEEHIPTEASINQREFTREIFHVLKSKEGCKVEASEQLSLISIDNHIPQNHHQMKSDSFLDVIKEAREKQVRADIFLSEDPFEPLKRFFKSKDSEPFMM